MVSSLIWVWLCYQQLLHSSFQHRQPGGRQQLRLRDRQDRPEDSQRHGSQRGSDKFLLYSMSKITPPSSTSEHVIPGWIRGSAGGPAGPLDPTRQGLFYDSRWRNESLPSPLLARTARPGHLPPSRAGPSLLLPKMGYRTGHLQERNVKWDVVKWATTDIPKFWHEIFKLYGWIDCNLCKMGYEVRCLFNKAFCLTNGVYFLGD